MVNISYIRLLNAFESFSNAHLQIKRFASDFPEQMPNFATEKEKYPILFVSPNNTIFDENANQFVVDVYCFDIIEKDRININTILSDTNTILNDVYRWFKDGEIFGVDVIDDAPTCTPINNELLDYAAGWKMSITFVVDTYGLCEIPFNEAPVVITEVCDIVYGQYLTCETLEDCPVIIDIQGLLPTQDQKDAMDNANGPDATNPFATMADVSGGQVNSDWNAVSGVAEILNKPIISGTNTGDQTITLTSEASGSGTGSFAVTLSNAAVISKVLTGFNVIGATILATDNILEAFGKAQNQINGVLGGAIYQGVWNATTNSPALISGVGTKGYYFVVSVAGATNLDGITDWKVGDWAIFNGTTWDKVDNTDAVSSVNGYIGAVNLVTNDIAEVTNLYFTTARVLATLLTGYTSGAGTIAASDSILIAIQKLNGNIVALITGVSSVNGFTGAVTLLTTNIAEGTNLYFTTARVNTQVATYTGDVTLSGTIFNIGALKVTNAMLAGSIDLTSKVTGALPIANGGTAATTAAAARANLKAGFTLMGVWAATNPADATTYYASSGANNIALQTARANIPTIAIPRDCVLKSVSVNIIQGAASSEIVTYNIDVNSVSTLIGTTTSTATVITVSNYAMAVNCLQGQVLYLQIVMPTWVTNPIAMRGAFTCYFE